MKIHHRLSFGGGVAGFWKIGLAMLGLSMVFHSTKMLGATPAHPFPQHTNYAAGCAHSTLTHAALDSATAAAYDAWKKDFLHPSIKPGQAYVLHHTEDREEAIAVSECHGYGMLLSAFMAGHDTAAQANFDALYGYFRAHPSSIQRGLMSWIQVTGERDVKDDDDSASDGDLDIAYALLLADRQWGSEGSVHYRAEALRVLTAIKEGDINTTAATVKLGDWAQEDNEVNDIRLSDIMPDHFRAFGRATKDAIWQRTLDRSYACVGYLQATFAPATGLLPDFARGAAEGKPTPAPKKFLETQYDGQYSYNACRVPWRLGIDALLTGDPRAKAALAKMNAFIVETTGGDPGKISAGYDLKKGQPLDASDHSLAFTAPFAVSAMTEESRSPWFDRLSQQISAPAGESEDAFGRSIAVLCLIAISGNWWSP